MSKLFDYFQKLEINPDQATQVEQATKMTETSFSNIFVPLQFESTGGECKAFYKYLKEHRDGIILDCEPLYGDRAEITKEFDLVIKFIEHDLKTERVQWNTSTGDILCTISKPSVFQSILTIYCHFSRPGLVTCYFIREQEEAVKAILGRFKELCPTELKLTPPIQANYSTLVVTEHADLHTAADVLANAWKNIYVPWSINDVLVQEGVAERFKVLLKERLAEIEAVQVKSPFIKALLNKNLYSINERNLEVISMNGANVVFGIQRDHLEDSYICNPIVTFNAFRTIKEAAALFNKVNGGSATIWSENISEALELTKTLKANNIWINCNGVLDPRCVYQFGNRTYSPGLLSSPFLDNLDAVILDPGQENEVKDLLTSSYGTSFFDGNLQFNVIVDDNPANKDTFLKAFALAEQVSDNPDVLKRRFARHLLKKYKTVAIRFGETFAN